VVPPRHRRRAADRDATDRDLAGIRFEQADQKVGESGLPGAGRPADAEKGPRCNREIEALNTGAGSARSVIVETDVAKRDQSRRYVDCRRGGVYILRRKIAFEGE